jgi:hypothetical protein
MTREYLLFCSGKFHILQVASHFQQTDAVTKTESHPFPIIEE